MPKKRNRWPNKRFKILNHLDKAEIIFKAIHRFDSGTTASELARKVNIYPKCAKAYLDSFVKKRLIKSWNIGRFRFYAPRIIKDMKGLNIRKFLEDEYFEDRNKKNVKETIGTTSNRIQ